MPSRNILPFRREETGRSGCAAWLLALAVIGGLIFIALHFGDLPRFALTVRQIPPALLLAALACQLATYVSLALGWQAVLSRAGFPRPIRKLVPIALIKLFADQAIPGAGMGGNVLLVDRLSMLGVRRGAAVATLLVSMIAYYAAYAAMALAMLVMLWLHHQATPLFVGLVTTLLLIAIAIPSLALWLRHRGSAPLPPSIERIGFIRHLLGIVAEAPASLLRDRRLIVRVGASNAAIFLLDAATLALCLAALGRPLEPASAFIALIAADIAVTLAPLPLGLGSFEATCTATLGMLGVPVPLALAATFLLRILTLWLPLITGLALMRTALRSRRTPPTTDT